MKLVPIHLTPFEAKLWDWAADPTLEYWDQENDHLRDDGLSFDQPVITFAERSGNIGHIHPHKEVIDDMIYRLEEQLPSMKGNVMDGQEMDFLRSMKTAKAILKKLREVPVEFGVE